MLVEKIQIESLLKGIAEELVISNVGRLEYIKIVDF